MAVELGQHDRPPMAACLAPTDSLQLTGYAIEQQVVTSLSSLTRLRTDRSELEDKVAALEQALVDVAHLERQLLTEADRADSIQEECHALRERTQKLEVLAHARSRGRNVLCASSQMRKRFHPLC